MTDVERSRVQGSERGFAWPGLVAGAALVAAVSCAGMKTQDSEPAADRTAGGEASRTSASVAGAVASAGEGQAKESDDLRQSALPAGQMLVLTAGVDLEVEKFDAAVRRIKEIARSLEGHVSSSSSYRNEDGRRSGSVEVKIPSAKYEEALGRISKVGDVWSLTEDSDDVTEEFVDLEARLSNQRRLEKRLLDILETKAGSVEDVLGVERELASVREKIETMEGRRRYLESRVSLSTITVSLHEEGAAPVGEESASEVFSRMMKKIGVVFAGSVGALVMLAVGASPWLVALGILVALILGVVRLARRRKKGAAQPPVAAG